jgi:hypothetical protein
VIDTLAVVDEQRPVGPGEEPANGPAEDQPKGNTEGNTAQNEDVRVPRRRVIAVILLLFGAGAVLLRLFLDPPASLAGTAALVVVAAGLLGAFSFFLISLIPGKVHGPLARVVGVAVLSGTLIATLLTIPREWPRPNPLPTSTSTQTPSPSPESPSTSPAAAPKKQTINATTDAVPPGEDPKESDRSGQGPLLVSAHHIVANSCSGAPGWRVPLTPKQLGTPPVDSWGNVTAKWAEKHHGIEASGTRIELTLQGKTKSAIVIKGIEINVVDKVKPSTGTHVVAYGECGGYNDTRYLVAKLDDIPPQVFEGRAVNIDNIEFVRKKSDRSFSARTFHVSKSDPERFILVAYGSKFDYSWQLVIRWLSPDGDEYITTVNNEDGKPFSTAVQKSEVAYVPVPVSEKEATWQRTTRPAE